VALALRVSIIFYPAVAKNTIYCARHSMFSKRSPPLLVADVVKEGRGFCVLLIQYVVKEWDVP